MVFRFNNYVSSKIFVISYVTFYVVKLIVIFNSYFTVVCYHDGVLHLFASDSVHLQYLSFSLNL